MNTGGFSGITEGLIKAMMLVAQRANKPVKKRYSYVSFGEAKHSAPVKGDKDRKVSVPIKYQVDTKVTKHYGGRMGAKELARAAKRSRIQDLPPILMPIPEAAE